MVRAGLALVRPRKKTDEDTDDGEDDPLLLGSLECDEEHADTLSSDQIRRYLDESLDERRRASVPLVDYDELFDEDFEEEPKVVAGARTLHQASLIDWIDGEEVAAAIPLATSVRMQPMESEQDAS